jgi:hypothetical protein
MGIYDDGYIYGLSWVKYDDRDYEIEKYEQLYDDDITAMDIEKIRPIFEDILCTTPVSDACSSSATSRIIRSEYGSSATSLIRSNEVSIRFYVYRKFMTTYSTPPEENFWFQWVPVNADYIANVLSINIQKN